jgi:hypothetical protein
MTDFDRALADLARALAQADPVLLEQQADTLQKIRVAYNETIEAKRAAEAKAKTGT